MGFLSLWLGIFTPLAVSAKEEITLFYQGGLPQAEFAAGVRTFCVSVPYCTFRLASTEATLPSREVIVDQRGADARDLVGTNRCADATAGDRHAALYLPGDHLYDFGEKRNQERLMNILLEEPVPIRQRRAEMPALLAAVIHRALCKEPSGRFPDAAALAAALRPFEA